MRRRTSAFWFCSMGVLGVAAAAQAAVLVRDGKPVGVVVLPAAPNEDETRAASELIAHVEKISGAKLPSTSVDAAGVDAFLVQARREERTPVFLGRNVFERLKGGLAKLGTVRGAFVIRVTDDSVMIAGVDEGTAYGVSELLEQMGVRWFMPGDLGTVIPRQESIAVAQQETVQALSFPSRWFQMPNRDWQVRLRCGGPTFPGAHGMPVPLAPNGLDRNWC